MSTVEQAASSRELSRSILVLVIAACLLLGAGFLGFIYVMEAGIGIPFEFLAGTAVLLGCIEIVLVIYIAFQVSALHAMFWKELAQHLGYTYIYRPDITKSALMFREGHDGSTGHGIAGIMDGRPFRLFQYSYRTGSGKHQQSHSYIVFELACAGSFPHLYLNNIRNRNLSPLTQLMLPNLPLPIEVEESFKLYAPEGYEVEALQVFTPDVLAHLMDSRWQHDVEITDQKLFVFRESPIKKREQLEQEIASLQGFIAYLGPKLDRIELMPIGDLTSSL